MGQRLSFVEEPPDQVFIVGMNGSGTTMLLDHLSSHPSLFGFPGETKVLPFYLTREPRYGDLSLDVNYERLWREMRESIVGQVKDDGLRSATPPASDVAQRSVAFVFDQLMRSSPGMTGKRIWCEKSPMHVLHLRLLGNAFPNAKFIHVIRDGRDCAASFHRRWQFNPRRTIARWKHSVRKGREQGASLGDRYLEVRYESVTQDPEAALRSICRFLGVEFDVSILSAGRSRQDAASAKSAQIVRNRRSAAHYFDRATMNDLERIAGHYLSELGYPVGKCTGDEDPAWLALRWWQVCDEARRLSVVLFRRGRILKPQTWGYLNRRLKSALKQKAVLGEAQYAESDRRKDSDGV